MLHAYTSMVYKSIHHFWWDVILCRDQRWMNEHNGYMFLSVYATFVVCVAIFGRQSEFHVAGASRLRP